MDNDKPYKTFDEQIDYLVAEHHLIIGHDQTSMSILKSMSYYDLINGYKEIFMTDGKHYDKTTILDLFQYSFADRTFQSIIFKYSVLVETRFRYIMANIIAKEFGETQNEYLSISKYNIPEDHGRRKSLYKTIKEFKEIYNPPDPLHVVPEPTRHYLLYKSHIPPWILFKNVSFSSLTTLYSFLPDSIKSKVSNELINFDMNSKNKNDFCYSALTIVRGFRNKIAHDMKFIAYQSNYQINPNALKSTIFSVLLHNDEMKKGVGRNDHFALLLCVTVLLNCIPLQEYMEKDLFIYFNSEPKQNVSQYLSYLSIPLNYPERLNSYIRKEMDEQEKCLLDIKESNFYGD